MTMNTASRTPHKDLVIGLDCSTTASKAIAFDGGGAIVAAGRAPHPLSSPRPGYYEQEPGDWWRSARKALQTVAGEVDPGRVAALAISNQRETFTLLDTSGKSLGPAIVWLDERCKEQVGPFSERIGKRRIHRITGKPPDYAPVVYRLAWLQAHAPALLARAGLICDVHSYLVWRLTGRARTSWASADPLGLFDLGHKQWSPVIMRALGLRAEQLPEACSPGTVLGHITRRGAAATGLREGTPVVSGGGDGQCAGLGSNVLSPRRAYLNLGTAVVAGVFGSRYRTSRAFRTMASCSASGYYYECSLRAGTFDLDWLVRKILKIGPKKRAVRQLEQEAAGVPAGSAGLLHLPYLCGVMNPYWDMDARGAFVGLHASHHRGHLYRAILEGIAFEQRLALEAVEAETKVKVRELVVIGGGAASELWRSILADITGKALCIPDTTEASALGAAIAAAMGAGWYGSFREAAAAMTGVQRRIAPGRGHRSVYQSLFEKYRSLYPKLRTLEES